MERGKIWLDEAVLKTGRIYVKRFLGDLQCVLTRLRRELYFSLMEKYTFTRRELYFSLMEKYTFSFLYNL